MSKDVVNNVGRRSRRLVGALVRHRAGDRLLRCATAMTLLIAARLIDDTPLHAVAA
jgi:hypothetical protein